MRVAIVGHGIEGKVNYAYFRRAFPDAMMAIADERETLDDVPEGAEMILGEGAFSRLADFDMVVRSPSVAPKRIVTKGKIWSATNEFFAKCPATIIGVTGTKGKGTTCSLIASILRAAGKTVHLVGNIGVPALEVLLEIAEDDIVVYELSSFQLWDLEKSPHIAVVLMVEPDHLDVHADLEEYLEAKKNIRRYQRGYDSCLFHPTNEFSREIAATKLVRDPVGFPESIDLAERYAIPDDNQAYVRDSFFCVQGRQICSVDNLQIPGEHNMENACAAISAVTELADWQSSITDKHITLGLRNFTGLPHRLKLIREVNGIKYYDDNYSSAPAATLAAVRAFDVPKVLILGGYDKGVDLSDLAVQLCQQHNIAHIILIGQMGPRLHELLLEQGCHAMTLLEGKPSMREIVTVATEKAVPGGVVIMSPACASFDMFKNFADRGDQFVAEVEAL